MTTQSKKPDPPLRGYELWKDPDFKKVLKKLGVDWEAPVKALTLEVPAQDPVIVTVTQYVMHKEDKDGS